MSLYDYNQVVFALCQRFGGNIRLYNPNELTSNFETGAVTPNYRIDFVRHVPIVPRGKTWDQALQMGVQYAQADYQVLLPGRFSATLKSHVEFNNMRLEVIEIVPLDNYGYLLNLKATQNQLVGIVMNQSDSIGAGGTSDGQL